MKKNKTIAYMMAATLLIGGASLGTKALFLDQAEAKGNDLIITMGNLHVKVDEGDGWVLKSGNKTEVINPNNNNSFSNVKAGDVFEKTITVKNEGSLKQNIAVIGGGLKEVAPKSTDGLIITNELDDTKEFSLEQGKDRKFKISVKVDENRDDKYQELKSNNHKDYIFFNLEKTFNQYTFQASQQKIEQNIQK